MAEDNRNRKPKRKYNPVLEWISDRLRYIELIAAILVVIIILVVLVRGILKKNNSQSQANGQAVQTVSADSSANVTSASNQVAVTTPAVSSSSASSSDTLKQDTGDVNAAVQTYFGNLTAGGDNGAIESYSDITTYTCAGPSDGTYIAFVEYTYKYRDYDEQIPGLSEFYIAPGTDGTLAVSDDSSAEIRNAMDTAAQTDAAKAMISERQTQYDNVVNGNADLKNFIASLDTTSSSTSSSSSSAQTSTDSATASSSSSSSTSTTNQTE
ncbi:MAG: hypothetical protein LIV24_01040 [Eubacterium sp.]|nr:hypothetical protein [Eubacterium sp.]